MKAWDVALFEYLRRIRSKWFIIGTFGMPVIILGVSMLSGYLAGSGASLEVKHYAIIDETDHYGELFNAEVAARYSDREEAPYDFAVSIGVHEDLREEFTQLVLDRSLDGYFVIPADFHENPAIQSYARGGSGIRTFDMVDAELEDILVSERARALSIPDSTVQALTPNVRVAFFDVEEGEEMAEKDLIVSYLGPFLFLFLLLMGIFTGSQLLLRAVLEERSSRIIEVLLSTLSHGELMTGKIFGLGLLGLTQSVIYLIAAAVAGYYFDVSLVTPLLAALYLVYFILGYLLFAAFFIGVGALFDSEQEAQQATSVLSILAVVPAMFWMLVLENPNSLVVNVLCYIPFFTPFFMIMKIAIEETSLLQILTTLVVMGGSVYLAIRASARIFKTGVLLYGKRITLPEIIRWIRA